MKLAGKWIVCHLLLSGTFIISVIFPTSAIGSSPVERIGPILFVSSRDGNNEIYAMNSNGENVRRLTNHGAKDRGPKWSPDGKKILFYTSRRNGFQIYTMDPDGSNVTNVTGISGNAPKSNYHADWSPNGKKIVFNSSRDGNGEIYVMNADGSNQIRLTDNSAPDIFPTWSPNGKKIAFISSRDGPPELYTMNSDGTGLFKVTSPPTTVVESVSWSPNGQTIAFASKDPGFGGINMINKNGTGRITLTNHPSDRQPTWSSSGREIIYTSIVGGVFEIFTVSIDGTKNKRLTTSVGVNTQPAWGRHAFIQTPPALAEQ